MELVIPTDLDYYGDGATDEFVREFIEFAESKGHEVETEPHVSIIESDEQRAMRQDLWYEFCHELAS